MTVVVAVGIVGALVASGCVDSTEFCGIKRESSIKLFCIAPVTTADSCASCRCCPGKGVRPGVWAGGPSLTTTSSIAPRDARGEAEETFEVAERLSAEDVSVVPVPFPVIDDSLRTLPALIVFGAENVVN